MKLTLISIWYQGNRYWSFVQTEKGKVKQSQLEELKKAANVQPGDCYAIGI